MVEERRSFQTISEIIKHIQSPHRRMIWVGKDYSKAELIADLQRIEIKYETELDNVYDELQAYREDLEI